MELLICCYLVAAIVYYLDPDVWYGQKISFRQYLRISSVAPKKWSIRNVCYCYLVYNKDDNMSNSTEIYMRTYFDQLRLWFLYKRKERRDFNEMWTRERTKLIKAWQKDINNYHDDYLEQIGAYLKKGKKL